MVIKRIKAIGLILSTTALLMVGHLFYDQMMHRAAAISNGEALYNQMCIICHGNSGREPISPYYPKINGQNVQYSFNQMKDIRDSKRTNGFSSMMQPIVQALTNEQLQTIAEYLATQR